MTRVAAVVESGPLFKVISPWMQSEFYAPLHAISTVDVANPYRSAAIGLACHGEIDGRNRHPIVRDREVEFNSERCPHAAISNTSKLYGGIGIKDRGAID